MALSRTLFLRLFAVVSASTVFGLIASTGAGTRYWGAAVGLAILFGFFFLLGTGHRILLAIFISQWRRQVSATWAGAAASVALATVTCILVNKEQSARAMHYAASAGLAINVAYPFVKMACIEAGCCRALRYRKSIDLRWQEIILSAHILAATGLAILASRDAIAASLAFGGHLALRYYSRFARGRLPPNGLYQAGIGLEIVPLIAVTALTVWGAFSA